MDAQTLIVALILAGALLYLGRRGYRLAAAARRRNDDGACGGSCCGK